MFFIKAGIASASTRRRHPPPPARGTGGPGATAEGWAGVSTCLLNLVNCGADTPSGPLKAVFTQSFLKK